ncbi:hypothetical protein LP419_04920 [Massilia sp. H-1]|nr:hypothetical protein LP419_04920 [Massilia sp. H-1]
MRIIQGTNDAAILSTATVALTGNERAADRFRHAERVRRRQHRRLQCLSTVS